MTKQTLITACLLALGTLTACSVDAPPADDCANLRKLKSTSGTQVGGSFGVLDEFTFEGSGSSGYVVVPPDTSECARDLAAKLESACRVCEVAPDSCESTVTNILDQPTSACTACGDGECQNGETPAFCPEDCGTACGDGTCDGDESAISCPEDCGTACGDGTCDGDESATTCPRDCGTPCGNGTCETGETPSNCARDCGAPCGNGTCESGESPLRCPQDCGGCTPNTAMCEDAATLLVCNSDGQSSSRRVCGIGQVCDSAACQSTEDPEPDNEVEDLLLGSWRVTVLLFDENTATRRVEVGNAQYTLDIFSVEPPDVTFGVWSWRGALRANSLCLLEEADIEANSGQCTPYPNAQLGRCSGSTCDPVTETGFQGTYDSVRNLWKMYSQQQTGNKGQAFHMSGQGHINLSIELKGEGTLNNEQIASEACTSSCSWTVSGSGLYQDTHPRRQSYDWSLSLGKISGE